MQNGIHFISGLPRSGSTLLAAILRQNPRFHAAMTGPVGVMYMALESAMSRRNETAVFFTDTQRRDVLRGVFTNYYCAVQTEKLVIDTNRIWTAKLPALTQLFPQAKVICCVRNIAWIMDSIERLVRKNAFELSGMFGFEPGSTVYTRLNRIATDTGPEYVSGKLIAWAEKRGISIQYIQPGKPKQNAYVERYNRTVRHEWLGQHIIETIGRQKTTPRNGSGRTA